MPGISENNFEIFVEYAGFLGDAPAFALADGTVRILAADNITIMPHNGLLCACLSLDGRELLTGGEDGKVLAINAKGDIRPIADLGNKWVDKIAAGPQGLIGFASGRSAFVVDGSGGEKEFTHARTIEGICFAPKGKRLALARYNGVSLHWTGLDAKPVELEWAGSHTGVSISPNGKFVVTMMQENALHGWRLDNAATGDGKHMRMTGYPAKVKSISWSPKGKWLASSGAPAAVIWPFSGRDGPMGKNPKELGTMGSNLVTVVCCHPSQQVVAIGYDNGMVLAARIDDGNEAVLRQTGRSPISSLNWDQKGVRLAFGSEAGEAGVIEV